jgi:hypothetical protein
VSAAKKQPAPTTSARSATDGKPSGAPRGRRRNGAGRAAAGSMPNSLEIAQAATLHPIEQIGEAIGLTPDEVEPYITQMPGLARESAAVNVDITETGRTVGLF